MSAVEELEEVLAEGTARARRGALGAGLVVAAGVGGAALAGALEPARYAGVLHTLGTLLADSLPPDFSRWRSWGCPLADTLAMSLGGTALGALGALVVAPLAGRSEGRRLLGPLVRLGLHGLRAVPGILWGVVFVAAVGFGPLPGMLALATHSVGTLGRLYAEAIEQVDPGPAHALEAQGVSRLDVLRFAVLPQVLPRLADATFYRWEHDLRAAMALGLVGAGGLGLELSTAFHLFEYREAAALVIVVIGCVGVLEALAAWVRRRLTGAVRPAGRSDMDFRFGGPTESRIVAVTASSGRRPSCL